MRVKMRGAELQPQVWSESQNPPAASLPSRPCPHLLCALCAAKPQALAVPSSSSLSLFLQFLSRLSGHVGTGFLSCVCVCTGFICLKGRVTKRERP